MRKEHRKLRRRPLYFPLLAPVVGAVIAVLLLAWALSRTGTTTLILVRHADLAQSALETGAGLSEVGRYRSKVLAGWLRESGISHIYVSDFSPTRETAVPVAESTGAKIFEIPATDPGRLADALSDRGESPVLVIADAETLEGIVEQRVGRPIEIADDDYAGLYVITDSILTRVRLLKLNYGG
ncbi:MAG: histidine phosphatase family protein [Gammaproteobacteria bacterium]|nr:MAG: histidine phosphatase family protein [Gammaproteobacteria bacterium]